MKVIDSNLLLYVVNRDASEHRAARSWWSSILVQEEPVGLSWVVLLSFVRISTHPRLFDVPLSAAHAIRQVEEWLSLDNVCIVDEKEDQWQIFAELIRATGSAGNLTTDAHLAALAISHDATLYSGDRDFARFPGLRWINPVSVSR